MIRAHVAAIKTLMVFGVVFDGVVPDTTAAPYRVMFADNGDVYADDLAVSNTYREWAFQTTSVGTTPDQARLHSEHTHTELLGVRPTVSGRSCGLISHEGSRPVERDDDVSPPVFYAVDSWTLCTVPA